MIKLIVSDLDGTLLNHESEINDRDREAVLAARREGYDFCIASGRMYTEIGLLMQPFNDRFHAVSQNGAKVHLNDRRLLNSASFDPETSSRLLRVSGRHGDFVNFIYGADEGFFLKERSDASLPYEARILGGTAAVRGDLEDVLESGEIKSCKFSYFGELDRLIHLKNELQEQFEGKLEAYISDKDCLDVMPPRVSKGAGLTALIRELGLRPDEIACIGDSFNDISMFALTKHSFAMRGSHVDVKSQANAVVHSVTEAIERIVSYNRSLTHL